MPLRGASCSAGTKPPLELTAMLPAYPTSGVGPWSLESKPRIFLRKVWTVEDLGTHTSAPQGSRETLAEDYDSMKTAHRCIQLIMGWAGKAMRKVAYCSWHQHFYPPESSAPSKQQQPWYFHASLGEDTVLWCVSISGSRDDFKQFKHTQPHRNLSLQDLGQMKIIMDMSSLQHAATSRIYRRHR